MNIVSIKEAGSNNIISWAITNNANIVSDLALQSLINDELCYIITLDNVNLFELFRLTQTYRDKLRIIEESKAEVPSMEELKIFFPGEFTVGNDKSPIKFADAAEASINSYINLVMQMQTDNDIISGTVRRLLLPMISRKFTIQIPVSFVNFISYMIVEESTKIFVSDYPNTLQQIFDENHSFNKLFTLELIKNTSLVQFDNRYVQYVNVIKYNPLNTCHNNKFFKFALLGCHKYDNVDRSEVLFNLFNINKNDMIDKLKKIGSLNTPLYVDFVISIPIQHMLFLLNNTKEDYMTIAYPSTYYDTLETKFPIENISTEFYSDDEEKVKTFNNALEAYKLRITEVENSTRNLIAMLMSSARDITGGYDIDERGAFSLLPSIYMTKAVITFDVKNINNLQNINDPILSDLFKDTGEQINHLLNDIASTQ